MKDREISEEYADMLEHTDIKKVEMVDFLMNINVDLPTGPDRIYPR